MDHQEKEFDADTAFKELVNGLSKATGEQQDKDRLESGYNFNVNSAGQVFGYSAGAGITGANGAGLTYPAYTPNISVSSNSYPWASITGSNDADFMIKGRSLSKILDSIEERLAILNPNPELENEWAELKELGQKYREMEKQIQEKLEVYRKLQD